MAARLPSETSRGLTDAGALGDKVAVGDPATVSLDAANETSAVATPREELHRADLEQARTVNAALRPGREAAARRRRHMAVTVGALGSLSAIAAVAAAVFLG
jgi:hypothetical protein